MLNRVGYTPEISHGMLVEMAEHKKDLEKKTKPILDTLRSYQDLPPVSCTLVLNLVLENCNILLYTWLIKMIGCQLNVFNAL